MPLEWVPRIILNEKHCYGELILRTLWQVASPILHTVKFCALNKMFLSRIYPAPRGPPFFGAGQNLQQKTWWAKT